MKVEQRKLTEIQPDESNPRINGGAVASETLGLESPPGHDATDRHEDKKMPHELSISKISHLRGSHPAGTSQSIEWFSEGQTRMVDVNGVQVTIRFVGRKGRRARIAISAPAEAVFRSVEPHEVIGSLEPPI